MLPQLARPYVRRRAHTAERTWISVVNVADGGWGIGGHALTNADIDEV
jgi:hypothetical protein